jgi:hypothetical protein
VVRAVQLQLARRSRCETLARLQARRSRTLLRRRPTAGLFRRRIVTLRLHGHWVEQNSVEHQLLRGRTTKQANRGMLVLEPAQQSLGQAAILVRLLSYPVVSHGRAEKDKLGREEEGWDWWDRKARGFPGSRRIAGNGDGSGGGAVKSKDKEVARNEPACKMQLNSLLRVHCNTSAW